MRTYAGIFAVVAGFLGGAVAHANVCRQWGESYRVGTLDPVELTEQSGMAFSRWAPDRLYHVNDSGDGAFLFTTDGLGRGLRRHEIDGWMPVDAEDLAVGPCYGGRSCVFIADIGDNWFFRETVSIVVVEEASIGPAGGVVPSRILNVAYPDGHHDAESLAVHPNGDLFILTKEYERDDGFGLRSAPAGRALPARFYRISRAVWEGAGAAPVTAEFLGEIDLPYLAADLPSRGQKATALDISRDGARFLVLTYDVAFEFGWDLSRGALPPTRQLLPDRDYQRVALTRLPQQESAVLLPDGTGFLYASESLHGAPAELRRVDCVK